MVRRLAFSTNSQSDHCRCFKYSLLLIIWHVNCDYLFPDPVQKVCLGVSDLQRSTHYWSSLLGMKVVEKNEDKKTVLMGFGDTQVSKRKNINAFPVFKGGYKKVTPLTFVYFMFCLC